MFHLFGHQGCAEPVVQPAITFLFVKKAVYSLYQIRRFFMSFRKKIISATLMVILILAVALTSVSFSFNVSQVSGSFVSKANISKADRDSTDIVQMTANIEAAGISGSIAEDVEDNLASAAKDIYDVNMARIAEAEAQSKAASNQTGLSGTPVNLSGIEAQILSLINSTRAAHGLSALSANQMLTDLARLRSNDMVSRNYFSHHSPDGKNIKHIFSEYGVAYKNFGENLGNASPASYGSPNAFLNAWMNSPGHRDNMLRSNYTLIGVGVTDGGGRRVVTVLFIR